MTMSGCGMDVRHTWCFAVAAATLLLSFWITKDSFSTWLSATAGHKGREGGSAIGQEAYVFSAAGRRQYFVNVVAAAASIRKFDSLRPIVLLYHQGIDDDVQAALEGQLQVQLRRIPAVLVDTMVGLFEVPDKCGTWKGCWLKFLALGLDDFHTVTYVDGDLLLRAPIEAAWSHFRAPGLSTPWDIAAVEDMAQVWGYPTGWHDMFNTGCFTVRPSPELQAALITYAAESGWSVNLADQSILNQWAADRGRWIRLPTTYNVVPYNYESMVRRIGSFPFPWGRDKAVSLDRVQGLHYTWLSKLDPATQTEEGCDSMKEDCTQCCKIFVQAHAEANRLVAEAGQKRAKP